MMGSIPRLLMLLLLAANATAWSQPAITPIASLDVPRYMGRWYEIAKFPNVFQRSCASDTSAQYRVLAEGTVQVINRCKTEEGVMQEAVGLARQVGAADSPQLKVRFAPAWLSWLPWVWGDYWVVDLDEQYQLAAVSEPAGRYLWILARSPRVDDAAYSRLIHRLQQMGLDTARLERSRHTDIGR